MVALTEKAKRLAKRADRRIVRRWAKDAGRWGENVAKAPVVVRIELVAYPAFGSREVVHSSE